MGTTLTPMAKALKAINVIKKDGVNRHSQYKFRGIDGVLDTVGPAFRENGILITSKIDQIDYEDRPTNNGKASTLIRGIVT
ncbi:ERF family protein, partial [Aerococcus urinae]|nr:ERF family protein [Aerococcus urinae]